MSVDWSKRNESKLKIFIKAGELCVYTIRLCSNENNFPKRYRWCVTSKIVDSVLDAYKLLVSANKVRVESQQDLIRREDLQDQAYGCLEASTALMDVAFQLFQLKSTSVDYWVGLVEEVQKLLAAWKKSDAVRFQDKVSS